VADQLGKLTFASWLRQGLATGITRTDGSGSGAATKTAVAVTFDNTLSTTAPLTLVGPGDIVGLHGDVIVRTWPKADDNDAEFGSLALIEFDQADLPWRYTPASADNSVAPGGRLRPWMSLLVFKEDAGEMSLAPPTSSLKQTVLTVQKLEVLPNTAEAWAWAHTQFVGDNLKADDLAGMIKGARGQFVARILCSRTLEPSTSYVACLVPTFRRGALVGTGKPLIGPGLPPDGVDALEPAWGNPGQTSVELPVYFSWRFQTGTAGSFKQLAKLIQPEPLSDTVGRRSIDVANPGLDLPSPVQTTPPTMLVEGAIQSKAAFDAGPSPWTDADQTQWVEALKKFLDTPTVKVDNVDTKVVAPPLYGRWYAAQIELNAATNPPWFFTLNADPRARVGGGLGTVVVQDNQQALVASAWDQAGEIDAVNARLKVAQLGREVVQRIYDRHIVTGTADTFWTLTGRLHAFGLCGGKTLSAQFAGSPVGSWIFDPLWRRTSRSLGPIGRFQDQPLLPPGSTADIIARLNSGQHPAPEPQTPSGLFTFDAVFSRICFADITDDDLGRLVGLGPDLLLFWGLVIMYVARQLIVSQQGDCFQHALRMMRFGAWLIFIANSLGGTNIGDLLRRRRWCEGVFSCDDLKAAPPAPSFAPVLRFPSTLPLPSLVGGAGSTDTTGGAAFRLEFCRILDGPQPPPPPLLPPPSIVDLNECKLELQAALQPHVTVERRFAHIVVRDASVVWQPKDPLEPIFAPPTYQAPMYAPLARVSQDWILPGINDVGRNSAGLGLTNQRFVEAYMVGCNQELTRELLFNGFPVDQRATYFRQFWDIAGIVPPEGSTIRPDDFRDILPIAGWTPTNALGTNTGRLSQSNNKGERLVLVVRAQLIQKYPNVIVYALPAVLDGGKLVPSPQTKDEIHPIFFGHMAPDVGFYGFDIPLESAASHPGFFFVLAEHPSEPKFGTDDTPGTVLSPPPGGPATTAGLVATTIFRDPFRVAFHGSVLLPPQA